MIINHNMNALNAHRQMMGNVANSGKSMEKLSSGLRINRAGDDAAGLAISEKMRGQIRGLDQAQRNSQDGISLIQTAEGALNETHSILQRMRELATQAANDTNNENDRGQVQNEINQLTSEVNKIGNTTEFNTIKLLDGEIGSGDKVEQKDADALIKGLKSWWINGGADIVKTGFGLEVPEGTKIKIVLDNDLGDAAALVSAKYTQDASGKATGMGMELELHVNMSASKPLNFAADKNGGTSPQYVDRVIAHEMTHAIMSQTMNFGALNTWFKEGVAEFAHGADERLASSVKTLGSVEKVAAKIGDGIAWESDSDSYSASYMAIKYLDKQLESNGITDGIKSVMTYLKDPANKDKTLDNALVDMKAKSTGAALPFDSVSTFITKFKAEVKVDADLETKCGIKLVATGKEDDTGSILGKDNGGTANLNAEDVIKETSTEGTDVPTGTEKIGKFTVEWPDSKEEKQNGITLQIGANEGQAFKIAIRDMRSEALGISKKVAATGTTAAAGVTEESTPAKAAIVIGKTDVQSVNFGTANVNAATKVTITVDGTSYDLDATSINAANVTDVATAKTLLSGAKDASAKAITDKADITVDGNKLVITSKTTGATSTIEIGVTEGSGAGTTDTDALKKAFGFDLNEDAKGSAEVDAPKTPEEPKTPETTAAFAKEAHVTNGTTDAEEEAALDMSSHASATAAIKVLDEAISKVSTERATLGSFQNRLEHTIANLGTSSENLTAAESRIRDVDMAKEMMAFTKNNILSQAAQAMLAQANQQPQGVLQLLR